MKTKTQRNTAAKAATKNTAATDWHTAHTKNGTVLIAPNGQTFHGTAQEVRDAAMTPTRRRQLAAAIEQARYIAGRFGYSQEECREHCAERRREAIKSSEEETPDRFIAHITQELAIVAEAAARYMGQTFDAFIYEAVDAAVRGTIDLAEIETGKSGLPLTRHERAALDRIKATKSEIEARKKARADKWQAQQEAKLAKMRATA